MDTPSNLLQTSSHQRLEQCFEPNKRVNQTVDTSDGDTSDTDPTSYFYNIDLQYFASEPLKMVFRHIYFMELCLENNLKHTMSREQISLSSITNILKHSITYSNFLKENTIRVHISLGKLTQRCHFLYILPT